MAQNFTDSPSNGATQSFNGVTYTYNSSKGIWTGKTAQGISLTDLSVGSEPSASGDGAVSYNNTTGVITYTPPVLSSGGTTTVYNTASLLPLSGNSEGDMAFAKDNNRFYVWNGSGWYSVALVNATPTISSGVASSVSLATNGTATVVTITASDPEGTALTYGYSVTSGSLTNGGGATATVAQGTGSNTHVFTVTPTTNDNYAGTFTLTFTASDGVNTATSAGAFSLIFSVPQTRGTAFKIKTSGTNARANSSFDDSSSSNHTLTPNGTAQQFTFSPYFPVTGYWSNYFDGTGDYLTIPDHADFDLTTGGTPAWTFETWIYPTNLGSGFNPIYQVGVDSSNGFVVDMSSNGSTPRFLYYVGSWATLSSDTAISNEVWTHIAVTFDGSYYKIFVNGLQTASATSSTAITDPTTGVQIGRSTTAGNAQRYFKGWISNTHFVKGTAKYTASFTPIDARITAHANTKLLTCRSNRFMDDSASSHTVTMAGNATVNTFSPFKATNPWQSDKGGSMYLDGAGDYLAVPDSTDFTFTGDFTAELWHYPTSHKQLQGIIAFQSDGESNGFAVVGGAGNTSKYHVNVKMVSGDTSSDIILNQWNHIALVRYGSGSGNIKLYVNGIADATTFTQTATVTKISNPSFGRPPSFTTRDYLGYIADARISNTARYTSNFTPPTSLVAVDSNTKLKANFSQAGIFDTSASSNRIQLIGNTKESTAQTKYATTSILMDNSGDYIVSEGEKYKVGTQPFQFEAWCYCTGATTTQGLMQGAQASIATGNQGNSGSFGILTSTNSNWTIYHNAMHISSTLLTANAWHHVAMVRSTGRNRLFLNGTQIADVADTNDYSAVDTFHIGGCYNTSYIWDGHIEDPRFLINHTTYPFERPQEALTAVSGTGLQFANASSIPSSPNGLTLTTTEGTPVVSSFTPHYSDVGYSIYYDGGSMHTVSANTNIHLGTGDFTIEGHFYIVAQVGQYDALFGCRAINNTAGFGMAYTSSNMYVYSADYIVNSIPYETKKWMHLVYQRKTISGTATHQFFRDGIFIGESTIARDYLNQGMYIGGDLAGSENSNMYVSDFRIIKGTAIYNKTFTPPSSAL